jgi:hypothetical protein
VACFGLSRGYLIRINIFIKYSRPILCGPYIIITDTDDYRMLKQRMEKFHLILTSSLIRKENRMKESKGACESKRNTWIMLVP